MPIALSAVSMLISWPMSIAYRKKQKEHFRQVVCGQWGSHGSAWVNAQSFLKSISIVKSTNFYLKWTYPNIYKRCFPNISRLWSQTFSGGFTPRLLLFPTPTSRDLLRSFHWGGIDTGDMDLTTWLLSRPSELNRR